MSQPRKPRPTYPCKGCGVAISKNKYCHSCWNQVVETRSCRNAGCVGSGTAEGTFGQSITWPAKSFTFPPTNCQGCRNLKRSFSDLNNTCTLCLKPYKISRGKQIMMLKNDFNFQLPTECPRCRNASPDERRALEREQEYQKIAKQVFSDTISIYKNVSKRQAAYTEHRKKWLKDPENLRNYIKANAKVKGFDRKNPEDYEYVSQLAKNQQIHVFYGIDGELCEAGLYPHVHVTFQPEKGQAHGRVDVVGSVMEKVKVGDKIQVHRQIDDKSIDGNKVNQTISQKIQELKDSC